MDDEAGNQKNMEVVPFKFGSESGIYQWHLYYLLVESKDYAKKLGMMMNLHYDIVRKLPYWCVMRVTASHQVTSQLLHKVKKLHSFSFLE